MRVKQLGLFSPLQCLSSRPTQHQGFSLAFTEATAKGIFCKKCRMAVTHEPLTPPAPPTSSSHHAAALTDSARPKGEVRDKTQELPGGLTFPRGLRDNETRQQEGGAGGEASWFQLGHAVCGQRGHQVHQVFKRVFGLVLFGLLQSVKQGQLSSDTTP